MNIKAVAEKAGVSITTVSRVLNRPEAVSAETRKRILEVMEELNYTPNWFARNLQSSKTNIIGLLVSDILDPANMEIAKGVEEVAHQKNCSIMLCNTEFDEEKERGYVKVFAERSVDGLVFVSTVLKAAELKKLRQKEIPYVLIGKKDHMGQENVVYTDYKNSSKEAVGYLIDSGRKNIAIILADKPKSESGDKLAGYKEALKEHGLPIREEFIVNGDNKIEAGFVAASKLLSMEAKPDAVFVSTDTMAFGAMERIKQAGMRIPEEIALIGFDDLPVGAVTEPKLTTVSRPAYRMGLVAARLLFDIMEEDGQADTQEIMLQSKLKIRKSCGNMERLREIW